MRLEELNAATPTVATSVLRACCDAPSWVAAVREGRPYPDVDSVLALAARASRELTAGEVEQALAAHPRIGERAAGDDTSAELSRAEQAGVSDDASLRDQLREGNRAYEQRFGRVFLICASGLSGDEVLGALHDRLGNDEETEAEVVADELRRIALLRLRGVLER